TLRLYKVSRLDMGGYMCIAANAHSLGHRLPPMISLLGGKVKLKCVVEAHPEALIFWEKNGSMLQSSERIKMRVLYGEPSYKVEMKLLITSVQKEDFGVFKCIAKNPRGVTDGMITLTGMSTKELHSVNHNITLEKENIRRTASESGLPVRTSTLRIADCPMTSS
ncbi:Uncharacterized protein FKW44_014739, partial [Caligus rogercresseyi]